MRGRLSNKEYYLELGNRIRNIRKANKLSQKDVATELGVTFQQYQKYEKGLNRIPIKALIEFCELTNTDIIEIMGCTAKINSNNINPNSNPTNTDSKYNTNINIYYDLLLVIKHQSLVVDC